MKLLFDANLSPRLPRLLADFFPGSAHVRECGLKGFPDEAVWEYGRVHGYTVISKDSDFQQRSLLYSHPPKVVWLRLGNCTTQEVVQLIMDHEVDIRSLEADPLGTLLVLSRTW